MCTVGVRVAILTNKRFETEHFSQTVLSQVIVHKGTGARACVPIVYTPLCETRPVSRGHVAVTSRCILKFTRSALERFNLCRSAMLFYELRTISCMFFLTGIFSRERS